MKSTIAIIGATGKMGSALARKFAQAGYPLLLMGREQERLRELSSGIWNANCPSIEIVGCAKEAAWEADIIIPAVPYAAQATVAGHIKPVSIGKILISIANPFSERCDSLLPPQGTSAAEELQEVLPNSKVVKAFNTIFPGDFEYPSTEGVTHDSFIAGDDMFAVEIVSRLVRDLGFNPLVAGRLCVSRTLEGMMLMLNGLSHRYGYNGHAAWKVITRHEPIKIN